jgi:hypothetical protein
VRAYEIIKAKRDGRELAPGDIKASISSVDSFSTALAISERST